MNYLKLVGAGALLVALWWLWDADRENYAATKVQELATATKEEAERDWTEKLKLGIARAEKAELAASAATNELEQLKDTLDEHKTLLGNRDRIIGGLRNTIVRARRNEVSTDPNSACRAQELRSERLAGLLEEGQRLVVSHAEDARELAGLVAACEGGARRDAVMLRWMQRHIEAVETGAELPTQP